MKGPNRWGVFDWIILKNQMLRGSEHLITHANYYATGLAEIKANFARMFRTHSDTSSITSIAVKPFILYK